MKRKMFFLSIIPLLLVGFRSNSKVQAKKTLETGIYNVPAENVGLYVEVTAKDGFNRFKIPMNKKDAFTYYDPGDFIAIDVTNYFLNHKSPIEIYVGDSKGNSFIAGNGATSSGDTMYGIDEFGALDFRSLSANCYYLGGTKGKSTILIDPTKLRDSTGSPTYTTKKLNDVAWVQFGFSTDYNVGQKNSIERIYTVNYEDEIFDYTTPAFCDENGFEIKARDVFAKHKSNLLYDFTKLDANADLSSLGWTFSSAKSGSQLKGLSYSIGSLGKSVVIANSLENAVVFSFKNPSNISNPDISSPFYSSDLFAYIDLWEAENGQEVTVHDALAFKICTTYAGTPIRLVLTDGDDGEVYYTGSTKMKDSYVTYNYLTDDLTNVPMNGYWNCIWPNRAPGTAYFPYGGLIHEDTVNNGTRVDGDNILTTISKVQLAFDTAGDYCYDFSCAIGSVADVDLATNNVNIIFDTATYSYQEANVNDATYSTICKPASEPFKNYNWKLSRLTKDKLVYRDFLDQEYRGDVKILQDFSLPEDLTNEEAQHLASNYAPMTGQKQYAQIVNAGEKFKGALKWTIGDYNTEFVPGNDVSCTMKVVSEGSTMVPYWYTLSGAKGFSVYVKNLNDGIARFSLEFGYDQLNGEYQHFGINMPGTIAYAYDLNKDKSMTLMCDNAILLPKGFEGFVRIPFNNFTKPAWNVEGADIYDGRCSLLSVNLSCLMQEVSNQTILVDEIGLYYSDFVMSKTFNSSGLTIKECMESNYFGE